MDTVRLERLFHIIRVPDPKFPTLTLSVMSHINVDFSSVSSHHSHNSCKYIYSALLRLNDRCHIEYWTVVSRCEYSFRTSKEHLNFQVPNSGYIQVWFIESWAVINQKRHDVPFYRFHGYLIASLVGERRRLSQPEIVRIQSSSFGKWSSNNHISLYRLHDEVEEESCQVKCEMDTKDVLWCPPKSASLLRHLMSLDAEVNLIQRSLLHIHTFLTELFQRKSPRMFGGDFWMYVRDRTNLEPVTRALGCMTMNDRQNWGCGHAIDKYLYSAAAVAPGQGKTFIKSRRDTA